MHWRHPKEWKYFIGFTTFLKSHLNSYLNPTKREIFKGVFFKRSRTSSRLYFFGTSFLNEKFKCGFKKAFTHWLLPASQNWTKVYSLPKAIVCIWIRDWSKFEFQVEHPIWSSFLTTDKNGVFTFSYLITRTTDAQRANSLHCMAENSIPIPNF